MSGLDAKKICLVRPSAIGDTVHGLALLNGLREGFPDAHIAWIIQSVPGEMITHQETVDQLILFKRRGKAEEWLNLSRRIRKNRYDLAIIPHASGKTSLITALLRADMKLGFDRARSRDFHHLVTNRHIPPRPIGHVQDQFLEFLEYLGIRDYAPVWNFRFTKEEIRWQKSFFNTLGKPAIGFVVTSAHPEKDWSPDRYARVIDHVAAKQVLTPMLIGGPSRHERNVAEKIAAMSKYTPVMALEKPIRKTMLQLAGCRLVVSPDTGPLHIAVAMNTPVIGLYGYSNPKRCGPYKKFHDLLIDQYNESDGEHGCISRKTKPGRMNRIQPEEVIEKIEMGLERYSDTDRDISVV